MSIASRARQPDKALRLWEKLPANLPNMRKTATTRQVLRQALVRTAFRNLRAKYGAQDRKSLRVLARAIGYRTYREKTAGELVEMYRKAEELGRVA